MGATLITVQVKCGGMNGYCKAIFFPSWRDSPQCARASSLSGLHDHTQAHHTRWDSSGRVISPTQRPLPDNTQHSQETDIRARGGIRTRNPSKRGHRSRHYNSYVTLILLGYLGTIVRFPAGEFFLP
jgi:hypothetical protein